MSYTIRDSDESAAGSASPGLGRRLRSMLRTILAFLGFARERNADGTLGPHRPRRAGAAIGVLVGLWLLTTIAHIVPAGNMGVPVTLGRAGSAVGPGFHVTWPFTSMKIMSSRTTAYTMAAASGEGTRGAIDDSVHVLGSDGASGAIDSTVLYRLDKGRATEVYNDLGDSYVSTLIRPSARTCIRSVFTDATMVEAATTEWHQLEQSVASCMDSKLEPRGILLEDFQLREVHLEETLQAAVTAKTTAQQEDERQQFELSIAQQQAEITRVQAIATADAQQILACGGDVETVTRADGTTVEVVVPHAVADCDQAQLTPQYLQWTYIQALQALVDSPNNSTIILPFDQNLTPLLNIPGGSGVVPATTVPPTSTTTTTTVAP